MLTVTILLVIAGIAQASPIYSSNGVGALQPDEIGWTKAMGGAGIANADGENTMLRNPALMAAFTRYTFSFGINHARNTTFSGDSSAPGFAQTNVEHFKMVLPVRKGFALGWTVAPLSRSNSVIEFSGDGFTDEVVYTGGINVSSVSFAGSFRDFLRMGASINYNFGTVEQGWERGFGTEGLYDSLDFIKSKYKGYNYTFGVITKIMYDTSFALAYNTKSDLDHSLRIKPGGYSNPESVLATGTARIPESMTAGLSRAFGKFTANADFSMSKWEDAAITDLERVMYTDTNYFTCGIKYTPVNRLGTALPFYRKIPLAVGFKTGNLYYKSFPKVDTVTETAVTFGFGIPFLDDEASLVTSIEIGSRGDKGKNGWEESYINVGFLVSGLIK